MGTKKRQRKLQEPAAGEYMTPAEGRAFLDQWAAWVNGAGPTGRPRWLEELVGIAIADARRREKQRHGGRPPKVATPTVAEACLAVRRQHPTWTRTGVQDEVGQHFGLSAERVRQLTLDLDY